MDRFYLSPDQWGESPVLTGDEAHHCCRVIRKQVGDEIAIFDKSLSNSGISALSSRDPLAAGGGQEDERQS